MPLARLENFLKNLNGNTLYVDPSEIDSTDSIENRGNSRLRPFKTIQRALIEAARFSYVAGENNDLFDQTTILISPGTHYIDNRPGYYVNSSDVVKDVNNTTKTISEFNILSNFDITDFANELYIYNSANGGVILPKGTSLVATDLRKTKIRPLFVPDPAQSQIEASSIFRLTGACYFFGFTIFDGDPLGTVYNTYSTNRVNSSYSHHKLTAFEYADGVNKLVKNSSNTGHTDLEMYYYKLALGFGQQSTRSVIDGYANFQPNIDEYRIVGDLGAGKINIISVISGNGTNGTNVITVITDTEHELTPLTPILISGVGNNQGPPTTTEYNGNFIVAQVISPTSFTYLLSTVPTASLQPDITGSSVKVISDTVTSASPYIFNCSLKSVYGMNGLHADGSKATGFKSIVTAQFTGISLQKDDRAFVSYDSTSGTYLDQTSFGVNKFLHQETNSVYQPTFSSFHIKASNDAFIQCVSIFAIGYASQFVSSEGGDQSITNSNSNFGEKSLFSEGFKANAFPKDDHGFITHLIPPKDASLDEQNINTYVIDNSLPNSNTKIYLKGFGDILTPPNAKVRKYTIGGRKNDKIYYNFAGDEYYADITPNYQVNKSISATIQALTDTASKYLTLSNISGISTGLAVKIISNNSILPDGITHDQTYFVKPVTGTKVRIYENLSNCLSDIGNTGDSAVSIQNTVGITTNNLSLVSRVSDLLSGDVGSSIQWDDTIKNWYVGITTNAGSLNFVSNISTLGISPLLYLKRIIDTRSNEDRSYRVRYVISKDSQNIATPTSGFILQKSGRSLNSSYTQNSGIELSSPTGDQLASIRNSNAIIDAWYSSGTATIVTKNPHNLRVGNKVSIYNLKSSNEPNPIGIGTGTGFNGKFEVASVVNEITFTYLTGSTNPGTITAGISIIANWLSTRDCSQTSNFRVPPYTIYDTDNSGNRENLPYFTCDQIENNYQVYKIKEIQSYVSGSVDGVYHITLDAYKNTPITPPFNTSQYKFGQSLDNLYSKLDFDNLIVDPDPSTTVASRSLIGKVDINDPYLSSTKEIAVQYLKDFNLGNRITGFSKSGNNVTITTERNHGIGGIRRVVADSLGSGYLNGIFYDIPLCGGSGSNATVNVTVVGGVPTTFEIANPGSGYIGSETLTVKGIPGSATATTVTIPLSSGVNFNSSDSDVIQILGATNSENNGIFVITSVTTNTITFVNANGAAEATTDAVVVMSGPGYPVGATSYDATSGITTVSTSELTPFSLSIGNKVLFDINIGICTITSITGVTTFTVKGDASSATKVYSVGLIPTLKDTNKFNENLTTRNFVVYSGYKGRLSQNVTHADLNFSINNPHGLKKGDFVQVESEIMLITKISGGTMFVKRALFGTLATSHANHSPIKTIKIIPVELRRPSILRASGHTFEYTGFGPGNYSTAMPTNQTKVLSNEEVVISQSLANRGGYVVYTGMNNNGEFFIGKKKFDASSGEEIILEEGEIVSDFDTLTVNKIIVNQEIDASTAFEKLKDLTLTGISTVNQLTILGPNGSPGDLYVSGLSTFVGFSTFRSGVSISGVSTFVGFATFRNSINVTGVSTFNNNVNVGAGASFIGRGVIPIGGIIMWSGTIAQLGVGELTNWALCNGQTVSGRTTPDLRNRFIVGASGAGSGISTTVGPGFDETTGELDSNYNPGDIGGETAHQLTRAEMPTHGHDITFQQKAVEDTGTARVSDMTFGGGDGDGGSTNQTRSGNVLTRGSGASDDYHENRPPYYALAFIMRVS